MNRYKFRDGRQLRCGYTTGTCAAAAAAAAARLLLTGRRAGTVSVRLPGGGTADLPVEFAGEAREEAGEKEELTGRSASAGVRKDAGDDADITDGMMIWVTVRAEDGKERSCRHASGRT